ncbi:hypothetical protein HGRIS_010688 [Hohenbuehelia grisea]|uniref:Uncharacterized protein n=1 Tax=Hohenbuehelia grisea TaxID=104357 RepID=A0ABR3IXG1_9AGAR
MADKLIGKFVMAKPTRQAFAISSASWTGRPASKERPCLVTGVTKAGEVAIAPVCGAHYDSKTKDWIARPGMDSNHWIAVDFKGSGLSAPKVESTIAKSTLKMTDPTKLQKGLSKFKPCYLWVADAGEEIKVSTLLTLKEHKAIDPLSTQTLEAIRDLNGTISKSSSRVLPPSTVVLEPLK